ncbi:unnamed protein product, partial [Cladocopium goreaui]
ELDLNQDGLLSFQEMDELLQTLAPQLSQGQRQKLFCAADVTLDGRASSSDEQEKLQEIIKKLQREDLSRVEPQESQEGLAALDSEVRSIECIVEVSWVTARVAVAAVERPRHTVHDAMAELVVYGRESCSACKRFRGSCEHHGIKYRFADIDSGSNKAEMLRKLRATEWFKGGKFGLPLVDVYGKLLERPSEAAVKAARDALPKNDQVGSEGRSQVENLKRQFKDAGTHRQQTLVPW